MRDELLKYLSDKLNEEKAVLMDDIALGKAKEFGDYKFACGVIRGLLIANNHIIETAERLDRADD